jgi:N-acetyl-anhydromuramyl-L-alanine amidase AmpD/outer membrane biosynthesis protein TonB
MWLALALCASAPLLAAPLVLKDDYRSPRNKERPLRKATTLIVLHTTEAHAKSSLNKLSERGEAHYCVVEDGTVYRIIDRDREAFHAGRSMWQGKEDCDEFSIGIEVVGHHDQAVTLMQLAALKELIARLKRMYSVTDARVVCHSHVAYGAPNSWHKKKHRGRKRCGMLFAMPSVRARLGLTARPPSDPDVKAKRLVQADPGLADVLYGKCDTMASVYARRPAPVVMRPAPSAAKPETAAKPPPKQPKPQTAKSPPKTPPKKPVQPPKPPPKIITVKPPPAKPVITVTSPPAAKPAPPPIVKPAQPKFASPPQEEEDGVLANIGGFFKSTAKLIVPKKKEKPAPASTTSSPPPVVVGRKLERPPQILSRDPRDLAALEAMPGYVKGGPVSAELSPYRIAGAAWRAPTTYYYMNGRIVTGDKVNEKLIEKGAYIFYKGDPPEKR